MKAITVKQPWAWAIAHGGKDIENRTWATPYRGLLAIHAGSAWDEDGAIDERVIAAVRSDKTEDNRFDPPLHVVLNEARTQILELTRTDPRYVSGAIVAVADFERLHGSHACVRTHPLLHRVHPDGPYECSRWAVGGGGPMVHWELTNVRPLAAPVPCKGRLGLWDLPPGIESAVKEQIPTPAPTQ